MILYFFQGLWQIGSYFSAYTIGKSFHEILTFLYIPELPMFFFVFFFVWLVFWGFFLRKKKIKLVLIIYLFIFILFIYLFIFK